MKAKRRASRLNLALRINTVKVELRITKIRDDRRNLTPFVIAGLQQVYLVTSCLFLPLKAHSLMQNCLRS